MKKLKQTEQPKAGNGKCIRMGAPLLDSIGTRVVELPFARIAVHNLPGLRLSPEDLHSDRWVSRTCHRIARMINEDFDSIGEYVTKLMQEFEGAHTCIVYVEPKKLFQNGSTSMLEHRLSVTRRGEMFTIEESGKESRVENDPLLKILLYKAFEDRRPVIFDYSVGMKIEFDGLDMDDDSCHVYRISKSKDALALMPFYYREPGDPSGIVMLQGDLTCKGSNLNGFGKAYWTAKAVMAGAAQISNQLTQKFDNITTMTKIADFNVDFKESIRQLVEKELKGLYLVLLDVDDFKLINDTRGYSTANTVLRKIAETIKDSVRSRDKVSRYGGEEFVVILRDISNKHGAMAIAERIREKVAEIEMDGNNAKVTCSSGVCDVASVIQRMMDSDKLTDRSELLEKAFSISFNIADAGLKTAKREGKNRTCFSEFEKEFPPTLH
jgi:diguanylate cyclase (GGDEF)-like protein